MGAFAKAAVHKTTAKINGMSSHPKGDLSAPSPDASNRAPMHDVDRRISAAVVQKGHPTGHSRKR